MPCESLLEFMERDSRITLGFGVSISSWIQSGSGVLFLCGFLPILNFVGSWVLVKPDAMLSAFLGGIRANELKDKGLHLKLDFYKQRADLTKDESFGFTVLLVQYYLHLLLVGT